MDPGGDFITVNDLGYGTIPQNWVFTDQSDGSLQEETTLPRRLFRRLPVLLESPEAGDLHGK